MGLVVPLVSGWVGGCSIDPMGTDIVDRAAGRAFVGLPGNHAVVGDQITPTPGYIRGRQMKLKSHGHTMIAMLPRKGIPICIGLAWLAIFFFMATSEVAADEIRQHQVVDDVEVVLVVPHAEQGPKSRIESQNEHHLVVWLLDSVTSKPIEDAQVKAEVTEDGYAGSEKILEPMKFEGKPAYSGIFTMPGRVVYRIMIKIGRPGKSRVIEAHFKYQHHHQLRGRKTS